LAFAAEGPALCISTVIRGLECFMAIGEPESIFANDPDYHAAKARNEPRLFDPFALAHFEPRNAFMVVFFYARKAHDKLRGHQHPWLKEAAEYFWDRCLLKMQFSGYDTLSQSNRSQFEAELNRCRFFRSWTINGDRTGGWRERRTRGGFTVL
jgi:hypothetical protein